MDQPMITVKVRGAEALSMLRNNPHLLGSTPGKGAVLGKAGVTGQGAAGKAATVRLGEMKGATFAVTKGSVARAGEIEGARIIGTGKGAVVQASEIEAGRLTLAGKAATGAAAPKGAAVLKGAALGGAAGASATAAGKGLGLGLSLSTVGPILVLAAIGLTATGIYLYLRSRRFEEDFGEEEDAFAVE